jgi:adenylate cyclase class 2
MQTEYEATFVGVDKDEMRSRLVAAGATLVRPEFLQRRVPFDLPGGQHSHDAWVRVRDEGDKITLSLKMITGERIEDQKEMSLTVDDFDKAVAMMEMIGCREKSYQETKRELWTLDGAEITIDEWPFLEPFVEVEGESEEVVKAVSEKIGFNYADAKFCAVGTLYFEKYGIYPGEVNNLKELIFEMENPFLAN